MPHRHANGQDLCTGRKRWHWPSRAHICQKCGAINPATLADDPVMHFEVTEGQSLCGRALPTAGFFTDDSVIFEERGGSRCKACWRVYLARNPNVDRGQGL